MPVGICSWNFVNCIPCNLNVPLTIYLPIALQVNNAHIHKLGKFCLLADIYFTVAAVETTTLFSGSISMSFRRLSSYSELGIPGVRSSFLTA